MPAATITDTQLVVAPVPTTTGVFYPSVINRTANIPSQRVVYYAQVDIADTDTFKALADAIPANHILVRAEMNWVTTMLLTGSGTPVKIALGTSSDPDAVLRSAATLTKNTHTSGPPLTVYDTTAAITYRISSVDTNGAAAGSFSGAQSVAVKLVFDLFTPLVDAA